MANNSRSSLVSYESWSFSKIRMVSIGIIIDTVTFSVVCFIGYMFACVQTSNITLRALVVICGYIMEGFGSWLLISVVSKFISLVLNIALSLLSNSGHRINLPDFVLSIMDKPFKD